MLNDRPHPGPGDSFTPLTRPAAAFADSEFLSWLPQPLKSPAERGETPPASWVFPCWIWHTCHRVTDDVSVPSPEGTGRGEAGS